MALKLSLKSNEKIYIGTAVVSNPQSAGIELVVHNDVPVLRQKDILLPELANTPCKLIYLLIQLMYLDPPNALYLKDQFFIRVREVLDAAPTTMSYLYQIQELVSSGRYYMALKKCKDLITYEEELLNDRTVCSLPEGRATDSL
jgi:flagellar protein FlbT